MNKFNTQGGYFAPQGYLKVEAGGSHEENPNGGVQLGVDEQGVPNLLEEGEPVYDDYVYSDNITAEKEILEKHNIPAKYAGKLYSEVADAFVAEAEERPLDPISNSGLNAMLVRLADAQEEQKQIQQQRDLEAELSQMTPEELAELDAMLAEQEALQQQQQMEEQPMVAPEQAGIAPQPVEMPQEQMAPQPPMMACGGKMSRSYRPGGTLRKRVGDAVDSARAFRDEKLAKIQGTMQDILGIESEPHSGVRDSGPRVIGDIGALGLLAGPAPVRAAGPLRAAVTGKRAAEVEKAMEAAYNGGKVAEAVEEVAKAEKAAETVTKTSRAARKAKRAAETGMQGWGRSFYDPTWASRRFWKETPNMNKAAKIALEVPVTIGGAIPSQITYSPALYGIGAGIQDTAERLRARHNASSVAEYEQARHIQHPFGMGGQAHIYDGPTENTQRLRIWPFGRLRQSALTGGIYVVPSGGANQPYFWPVGRQVSVPRETVDRIADYFPNEYLDDALNGVTENRINVGVSAPSLLDTYNRNASRRMDITTYPGKAPATPGTTAAARPAQTRPQLPAGYTVTPEMVRRMEMEDDVGLLPYIYNPLTPGLGRRDASGNTIMYGRPADKLTYAEPKHPMLTEYPTARGLGKANPATGTSQTTAPHMYSTLPRYAGAGIAGALAMYNAAQEPDRYDIPDYSPVLPYGRMHLIDPAYNGADENMVVQDILANSAGNTDALANSGLGTNLANTLLAADYNVGRNLGNGRLQVWDANNQARNNIVAAHNQNAATQANFDYGVNRERAHILNDAERWNLQNDLYQQRLNYEAERQKYAALQTQLNAIAEALSGIGQENFVFNQLNTNRALYDSLFPNGAAIYRGAKFGGPLLKPYKK